MNSRRESLFAWVASLPPYATSRKLPKQEDFQDGIMLGKILKEVIDPSSFADVSIDAHNPTPLAKIVDKMKRYFAQQENGHLIPFALTPNSGKIVSSGDIKEICRLLQLLLVCAVNCPTAESFITNLRQMNQDQQGEIMSAIQELMVSKDKSDESEIALETQLRKAMNDILMLNEEKEQITQTCHELQVKLSQMTEEKSALIAENEKLALQVAGSPNDPQSLVHSKRIQEESKREIDQYREENLVLENQLDDHKLKLSVLEKQLSEAHAKLAAVAAGEEEIVRLKDEIDSLREAAAKVTQYEQSINTYKKKLEEMGDLKVTMKQLEEKNVELDKANFSLEEELKKVNTWKTQLDAVKKELAETQHRLSQETQKALKAGFDFQVYREKFENEKGMNERLKEEKDKLTHELEELRLAGRGQGDLTNISPGSSVDSIELLPPAVRQRMVRLELENQKLKEDLKAAVDANPSEEGAKVLVELLRKHESELEESLLKKDQQITDMQSSYDEKIRNLQTQISAKDEELKKMEARYNKNMEKAKSVITTLEPTRPSAALDVAKSGAEIEKARQVREMEEKLLASAFYNYGLSMHRNSVDTRNQTMLQRHRQNASSRRKSEI